jgi:integrase/recombinase XerD
MKYSDEKSITNNISNENSKLIEKFISFLHIDGCSQNTILAYKNDLKQFQKINNNDDLKNNPDEKFQNFISNARSRNGSKLSYASLLRKISSIRIFYRFLFEEKNITTMPKLMMNFQFGKIKQSPPKMLSKSEIDSLLDGCKAKQSLNPSKKFEWLMMESLIEVLYSTGARISEALSLKINQIFDNTGKILNEVVIPGKNKKERIIFLNHKAQNVILKFLKEKFSSDDWMRIKNAKDFLFNARHISINLDISKIRYLPISRHKVYHILKKLALSNNIDPEKISPHVFRHSIAVHLLLSKRNDKQNNIALIKSFLGHETIETTKIYLNYEDANIMSKTLNNKHPLGKLNNLLTKK